MSTSLVIDDGRSVPVELATTAAARARGLLGRDGLRGALLLAPATSVHTFRMRFAIEVAFCDRDLTVIRTATMAPNRMSWVVLRSRAVIEAQAGAFAEWGLDVGSRLAVLDATGRVVDWRA